MAETQAGKGFIQLLLHFVTECLCIDRLPAYLAADEIQGDDRVPAPFEQVSEFDGLLGADPPAISAPGAKRHAMEELTCIPLIFVCKSACRAVFNTSQTSVAFVIYLEIGHIHYMVCPVGQVGQVAGSVITCVWVLEPLPAKPANLWLFVIDTGPFLFQP